MLIAASCVLACILAIRRGWLPGWMIWLGLLGYLIYGNALFAFDRVYTPLFPV